MSLKNELKKMTERARVYIKEEKKRQKEQENTKCSRLINQFKKELYGKARENLDNRSGLLKSALNGNDRYRLYHAEKNEKLHEDITKCKIMKKFVEENEETYPLSLRYGEYNKIGRKIGTLPLVHGGGDKHELTPMCEIYYSWYL